MKYLGSFETKLDEKNRLIIPAKWRSHLGSSVIVSKGFDGCLTLRSTTEFEHYYQSELSTLNVNQKNSRLLLRQLLANAADLTLDKAHRILLPNHLISAAQLTKAIVLIGLGSYVEVWDREHYQNYLATTSNLLETVSENH